MKPLAAGPFGPFDLIEQLGKGGMGEVWLAHAVAARSQELCVVKVMRTDVAHEDDGARRFTDEASLAALLAHPRISRVLDAGRVGDAHFMALELVEGLDLVSLQKRALAAGTPLDEGMILWIAACALDALAYAHRARHPLTHTPLGVVHRDISPHNVMCDAAGAARVIDFGLALSALKQTKTEQNVVLGKLAYMSPEQARGEAVDGRCDLFAAGVMFYELFSRQRFWGDLDTRQIWMKVATTDYVPPHFAALPADIAAWLAPLLERDPARRSADAAERRDALAGALRVRGGAAKASARLGSLVADLAGSELARVARARSAIPPPAAARREPVTESIAVALAPAIHAALGAPTLLLPAFTALIEERERSTLIAMPAVGPGPRQDVDDVATARMTRAAPPARPQPRSRLPLVLAGVAVVVGVVAGVAVFAPGGGPGAGPPPTVVSATVTTTTAPTTTTTATTTGPTTTTTTTTTATTATASLPAADPWAAALAAIASCSAPCARIIQGSGQLKVAPENRAAVLATLERCARICRRR